MTIYLVRHGQSEANRDSLFSGVSDHRLTELGSTQALSAGERFAGWKIDSVFTSGLSRAVETAGLFLASSCAKFERREVDNELNERNFGIFESTPQPPEHQQVVGDTAWRICHDIDYAPSGGESMRQTHMRAVAFLNRIKTEGVDGDILIVSHGNIIRSMTLHALGWPIRMLPLIPSENGLVTRLGCSGRCTAARQDASKGC